MTRTLFVLMIGGLWFAGPSAWAKPAFLKKAKELNMPGITTCMACHVSTKKGNVVWNERGLWLKEKKKALDAKDVDVTWLKDYPVAN